MENLERKYKLNAFWAKHNSRCMAKITINDVLEQFAIEGEYPISGDHLYV